MSFLKTLGMLWLTVCFAVTAKALQSPVLESNDVVQTESAWKINGVDPYFVLPLEPNNTASQKFIEIPISIENFKRDSVTIELFYAPTPDHAETKYDPLKRIRFDLELPLKQNRLVLSLPDEFILPKTVTVRLDIDGCEGCTISNLGNARFIPTLASPENAIDIEPHHIIDGVNSISEQGLTVPLNNWLSNDFIETDFGYQINGGDPYLISPIFDAAINDLGGLLLELETNQATNDITDFQLFYATEQHRFIEAASTIFRVQNQQGKIRVFLPFDFLKSQPNPSKLLRQLRLDIAQFSVFAKQNAQQSQWKIKNVKLVNAAQAKEYQRLIPSDLFESKSQRIGKRQTLKGIFNKFVKDWLFSVFYFTLIFVFCFTLLFKLRKLN